MSQRPSRFVTYAIVVFGLQGRSDAASEFPDAHADDLGERSTADLDVLLAEC
jgi:hypothetical protein